VRVTWSAPGYDALQVYADGNLWTGGGSVGSQTTGVWVREGMVFTLKDSQNKMLASASAKLGCKAVMFVNAKSPSLFSCGQVNLDATVIASVQVNLTVDWGDGIKGSSLPAYHRYLYNGDYPIRILATSTLDPADSATATVTALCETHSRTGTFCMTGRSNRQARVMFG
jgi:hypothetical protein